MSRKEKLIKILLTYPKDFSWDELTTLLANFEFREVNTGNTSGSRRRFTNDSGVVLALHKPHPQNILKRYQLEQIIQTLQKEKLL